MKFQGKKYYESVSLYIKYTYLISALLVTFHIFTITYFKEGEPWRSRPFPGPYASGSYMHQAAHCYIYSQIILRKN
jgi:hypothetical protein